MYALLLLFVFVFLGFCVLVALVGKRVLRVLQNAVPMGQIRVGKYDWRKKVEPATFGFKNVLVHVKESMSPFQLKNEANQIMENVWQFQKCYPEVTRQQNRQWSHPAEKHFDSVPLPAYWKWRKKGMAHFMPVRWPNGRQGAATCLFLIVGDKNDWQTLDYVSARKRIYYREYARLVRQTTEFKKLQAQVRQGQNIQINEVDGPLFAANDFPFDQVQNSSLLVTREHVTAWVNNGNQPFGHGICLAIALYEWDSLMSS